MECRITFPEPLLELKNTEHSYYCSESNYYVNGYNNFGRCDYDSWQDFRVDWLDQDRLDLDDDYNHLFRFDICEDEEKPGNFRLLLFFVLQRKGIYLPVVIHKITKDDLPEIEVFLNGRWEYMKSQWSEFSEGAMKHGKWIRGTNPENGYWICSSCGTGTGSLLAPIFNKYCSECGSKMDMEVDYRHEIQ